MSLRGNSTRWIGLLMLIVSMAGCTQNQWAKQGASEQDFLNDRYACHQMFLARYGAHASGIIGNGDIEQCLRDYGYRDLADIQMANDPRAHLTPDEIKRIKSEIDKK
jgi:hypothetical protein